MGQFKLIQEIISLSNSKDWETAKTEWELNQIQFSEEPETCICGHYPIIELCILKNVKNANYATVGNSCVKKFLDLPSDMIFNAVKRVKKNLEKSFNKETIELAFKKRWINRWEYDFSVYTLRKRNLSEKQSHHRKRINTIILKEINKTNEQNQ